MEKAIPGYFSTGFYKAAFGIALLWGGFILLWHVVINCFKLGIAGKSVLAPLNHIHGRSHHGDNSKDHSQKEYHLIVSGISSVNPNVITSKTVTSTTKHLW